MKETFVLLATCVLWGWLFHHISEAPRAPMATECHWLPPPQVELCCDFSDGRQTICHPGIDIRWVHDIYAEREAAQELVARVVIEQ